MKPAAEADRETLINRVTLDLAGLPPTVGCAKRHNHEYDVIAQADDYSMSGVFTQMDERGGGSFAARESASSGIANISLVIGVPPGGVAQNRIAGFGVSAALTGKVSARERAALLG